MSRRPAPRRRSGRPAPWLAWALLGLAALGAAGIGAAALLARPVQLDPETLCPMGQPPPAHTLILVDATDPLEPRHRRALEALARGEAQRLGRGGRLTLMSLDAKTPREPRMLFSLCHPGDGTDVNPLIGNAKQAAQRFARSFEAPLAAAVKKAESPRGAAARSPITEAVRAAAADPGFAAAQARRFVLVSDLMENPAEGANAFRADPALPPPPAAGLDGASVRVLRLDRPGLDARQRAAQTALWDPFFEASGASPVTYDPAP